MVRSSAVRASKPFRALFLALLPVSASAQTIYVDCGADAPSAEYGAAYGIPGTWNSIALIGGGPYPMLDAAGQATSVLAYSPGWCDQTLCYVPGLEGDHAALFEDGFNGDCYASPNVMFLTGLAAGEYQVFVYGFNACDPSVHAGTEIEIQGQPNLFLPYGGLPFTGDWTHFPIGVGTFTLPVSQTVKMSTWSSGYGGIAGFQLVHLGPQPVPFCFGNLGDCPCAPGEALHGCPSSFEPAGASLRGTGAPALGSDSFLLTAYGTSNTVVTFIQSETLVGSGFGIPFGDGLRCAGGNLVRLASKLAVGGVATFPEAGEEPISVRGAIPPGGGFRGYQVWYRDPNPGYCTPDTFNLTNAVAVEWY